MERDVEAAPGLADLLEDGLELAVSATSQGAKIDAPSSLASGST